MVAAVAAEGAAGLYIAADDGLFAKAGLHVTIQTVTSSSTVIPAMLHGSVDVASGQYTSYIAADAAGRRADADPGRRVLPRPARPGDRGRGRTARSPRWPA